ncbi:MAG: hypothetical protein LBP61_00135 [Desulfovibrio sp.]|nr:hypothetical protein [Desulfovibrio sp.]
MSGAYPALAARRPLILDLDGSVPPLDRGETRLPLEAWQETIRFGCSWKDYARFASHLEAILPEEYGCVFTGSGDFHHLSLLLLKRLQRRAALPPACLDLVICDNHPDTMRYLFGLHCGSWAYHAAGAACVRHVHALGLTSADITLAHAWENHLGPLFRGKLTYWSVGRKPAWPFRRGRGGNFPSADALIQAFLPVLEAEGPVYLSIDKDVLHPDVARTTWDQGVFSLPHLAAVIGACAGRLAGADICGDVSGYRYAGWGKRFLSRLDGQRAPDPERVLLLRERQGKVNRELLGFFSSFAANRPYAPAAYPYPE